MMLRMEQSKRIQWDKYVNQALNGHHPFIKIQITNFDEPELIANILEEKVNIPTIFNNKNTSLQAV